MAKQTGRVRWIRGRSLRKGYDRVMTVDVNVNQLTGAEAFGGLLVSPALWMRRSPGSMRAGAVNQLTSGRAGADRGRARASAGSPCQRSPLAACRRTGRRSRQKNA